jgi:hypothetical protein
MESCTRSLLEDLEQDRDLRHAELGLGFGLGYSADLDVGVDLARALEVVGELPPRAEACPEITFSDVDLRGPAGC